MGKALLYALCWLWGRWDAYRGRQMARRELARRAYRGRSW